MKGFSGYVPHLFALQYQRTKTNKLDYFDSIDCAFFQQRTYNLLVKSAIIDICSVIKMSVYIAKRHTQSYALMPHCATVSDVELMILITIVILNISWLSNICNGSWWVGIGNCLSFRMDISFIPCVPLKKHNII